MSTYTAFRCPEDILAKAKVKAGRERRSLSNYIITLLERDAGSETIPASTSKSKKRGK